MGTRSKVSTIWRDGMPLAVYPMTGRLVTKSGPGCTARAPQRARTTAQASVRITTSASLFARPGAPASTDSSKRLDRSACLVAPRHWALRCGLVLLLSLVGVRHGTAQSDRPVLRLLADYSLGILPQGGVDRLEPF